MQGGAIWPKCELVDTNFHASRALWHITTKQTTLPTLEGYTKATSSDYTMSGIHLGFVESMKMLQVAFLESGPPSGLIDWPVDWHQAGHLYVECLSAARGGLGSLALRSRVWYRSKVGLY